MVTKREPTQTKKWVPKRPRPWKRDATLMHDLIAIGARVPASGWTSVPPDASTRFDDYLEGTQDSKA